MHQHLCTDCRTFYHTSVRRQISFEYCQTACLTVRIVNWADYLRIFIDTSFDVLSQCLSGHSHTFCMKKSFLVQLIHHRINSAGLVEIFHVCMSCRSKMAQIRSFLADRIGKINLKIHSDLMCNRRNVQHTVCGTSQCHVHCQCI